MSKLKKIVLFYILAIVCFLLFHVIIWNLFTSKIFGLDKSLQVGGLARLGYQVYSVHARKEKIDIDKSHIPFNTLDNIQSVDIITLGDSFSNGGGGGLNRFYQDYIVKKYQAKVLNIKALNYDNNFVNTIIAMYNSGMLDRLKPKAIILESVERSAIPRLLHKSIDWDFQMTIGELAERIRVQQYSRMPLGVKIVNNINYNAFYSKCYKVGLDTDMFSVKNSSKLLFLSEDIKFMRDTNSK